MGPGLFPDAFFAQVDAVVCQNHAGRHSFLEKFSRGWEFQGCESLLLFAMFDCLVSIVV